MPSTYSTNLKITLIGQGEQSDTWGITNNANLGTLIDEAICATAAVVFSTDANKTMTIADGSTSDIRKAVLSITSSLSLTATRDLIIPAISKTWIVYNNTSGSQSVRIIVTGGAGASVTVANGTRAIVYSDGANVYNALSLGTMASQNANAVAITGGTIAGTTISGATISTSSASLTTLTTSSTAAVGTSLTVGTTLGVTGATTLTGAAQINNTLGVTGVTTHAAGVVGTPSVVFTTGGATTGFWAPAASATAWSAAGAEIWRSNATGLGVFMTPTVPLDVKGVMRLNGSTSGYTGFQSPAVGGSTLFTVPSADGSANQVLKTSGAGVLSFADAWTGFAVCEYRVAASTAGATFNASTWQKVALTETSDVGTIVSVTSDVMALTAGVFNVRFMGMGRAVNFFRMRLRDTTNNVTLGLSNTAQAASGSDMQDTAEGECSFTLAGATNVELQGYCGTTGTFGSAANLDGQDEIYARVAIWKVR